MSDPMTTIMAAGILCGLIVVGLGALLINRFIRGKWYFEKSKYDERQKIAMGKAYRDGFWTLIGAGIAMMVLSKLGQSTDAGFVSHLTELYALAIFLGTAVFAISSIMRDAYMGINDNAKRWNIMLAFLGACDLAAACISMEGDFWDGWYYLLSSLLFFAILAAALVKYLLNKGRDEE